MTPALRAHRLLCRLGLHVFGYWKSRGAPEGYQRRRCAVCDREETRVRPDRKYDAWLREQRETKLKNPAMDEAYRRAREALDRAEAGNGGDGDETCGDPNGPRVYPVDALNFPPINRAPRDGVTHE